MNGFIQEVTTQGKTLRNLMDYYKGEGASLLSGIVDQVREKGLNKILLTGMGSSLYATDSVRSLLTQNGYQAVSLSSFELSRYQSQQIDDKTLVIAISQSGRSFEVVEVLEKAGQKTVTVGISNNPDSKVFAMADFGLPLVGGVEKSITSITYAHTMLLLNLLAHALIGRLDEAFMSEVDGIIAWIDEWNDKWLEKTQEAFDFASDILLYDFIANNASLPTAKQMALACREGLHNCAASWECADYAHGQYHSSKLGASYLAQFFIPVFEEGTAEMRMVNYILEHGGKVLAYTASTLPAHENLRQIVIPPVRESLSALMESIAAETLLGRLFGPEWIKDH